jgi:hypothetical protein
MKLERLEVGEGRLLPAHGSVREVVGDQDGVDLPPRLARLVDEDFETDGVASEGEVSRRPTEGKAPVELVFIVGRHDRLRAELGIEDWFELGQLIDSHREGFGLSPMIDVPNPDAVPSGPQGHGPS